ncbi:hypothetical protein MNBD_ACTINO02-1054 [hydrothermal vent metagenome]|uniref:ABM domain-containing protein n=1 Tax=hydrothermal vent metagenome TaxID=652676 RepID=A0A3B0SP41_9ZZZZ
MIARIWKGTVAPERSDEYLMLMRTVAIPDYQATPGNIGAYALRHDSTDGTEFVMLTFWESKEAIKAFAGDDIAVAKYYDFDGDFLLDMVPTVEHFEVFDR